MRGQAQVAARGRQADYTVMRFRQKENPLWRWWWLLGGVAVAMLIAAGVAMAWSANLWAISAVVAAVYLGVPGTALSLRGLNGVQEKSGMNGGKQAVEGATRVPATTGEYRHLPTSAPKSAGHDATPSREALQLRIAEMSAPPSQRAGMYGERPWRRVGSVQFAELVQALGKALPSVSQADDTAALAGVSQHLIRTGRDYAVQRWHAVLERAIDDEVDDAVCSEALKLTNSPDLRSAVADWLGIP